MPLNAQVLCTFEADWTVIMETYPDAGEESLRKEVNIKIMSMEQVHSSAAEW